jgi:uncharacterized protein (TIGR03086 family)
VSVGDLDKPTPCASWTIKDLVSHTLGVPMMFAAVIESGAVPDTSGEQPDPTREDFNARYAEATAACVAAFGRPGVMDQTLHLPFGDIPGSIAINLATNDAFVHGWDLAMATGQSTDLDPELATELLASSQMLLSDDLRGEDGKAPFGPRVELTAPGTAADKLAAFTGRHPA